MSAKPCGCDLDCQTGPYLCGRHRAFPCHRCGRVDGTHTEQCYAETTKQRPEPVTDAQERKRYPVGTGVLDYFPQALLAIAEVSRVGNDQHNPGEPLHWARGKSMDQADCLIRHFLERGTLDTDGQRHSAKLCWRALALLQLELEGEK